MPKTYSKTLIICPHADDEMFCLGFLNSKEYFLKNIDFLIIHNKKSRLEEAKISASINKLNLLNFPININCKGDLFHHQFNEITEYFSSILYKYDLILSPLIEGGHQDHDTVTAALIIAKDKSSKIPDLFLYPTYRGLIRIPWMFRCGIPNSLFKNERVYFTMPNKWLIFLIRTWLNAYKSQSITWFILLPALIIAKFLGQLNSFIKGNEISLDDIKQITPSKPFYQTYRNLTRNEWLKYLNLI